MIMVTTQEEYEKLKWYDLVTCRCENKDCEKEFKTIKKNTQLVLMGTRPTEIRFCNRKCSAGEHKRFSKFKVNCKNCKKEFFKTKYQCEKFPNHFCSSSCAATYNNKNKTYGIRRSKFEAYIEDQLIVFYSYLKIDFNKKEIGSELDIFIPELKLAIEINGITHYKPIYGEKKFLQIQNNDKEKIKICKEKGIELFIIDVSKITRNKEKFYKPSFNEIKEIINSHLFTQGLVA